MCHDKCRTLVLSWTSCSSLSVFLTQLSPSAWEDFYQNVYSHKKHLGNRDLQSQRIPCSEIPEACGDFSCGSQLRAACPMLPWQRWIPRSCAVRALGTFPSAFLAQGKPMCVGVFTALPQGAVSSMGMHIVLFVLTSAFSDSCTEFGPNNQYYFID